ncbi:hypothetical protein O181_058376 [Austropuccinia psidii MF-1]|uniref:CCHC-type domain-containing protein n=1 Tax=Austropuccinia psidii MF-1 TaxID=1389203 RepID=A0A9Q3EGY3_9BASI|nr:hypothetical protein [Austropuccinia psidii MF-1]
MCNYNATGDLQPPLNSLRIPPEEITENGLYYSSSIDPTFLWETMQGTCFNCNKTGHFPWDHPMAKEHGHVAPLSPMHTDGPFQFQAHYPIITPSMPQATFSLHFHPFTPHSEDLYWNNYNTKPQAKLKERVIEVGVS